MDDRGGLVFVGDPFFRDVPIRVLDHHDRRVDQDTDGQRQAAERHDVGGHAEVVHRDERGHHGDRQRQNRNERRSEMEQEDDDDDGDDDRLFDQRVAQRANRFADQSRTIVGGDDLDARRHRRLDFLQLRFHPVNDVQRVFAEPHDDDAAHRLAFAVQLRDATTDVRAEPDLRHVAHANGRASRVRPEWRRPRYPPGT